MKDCICDLKELAGKIADGHAEGQDVQVLAGAVLNHIERHCYGMIEILPKERQELIDKVIDRMKDDLAHIDNGIEDWTAIEELLLFIPDRFLKGYLPED